MTPEHLRSITVEELCGILRETVDELPHAVVVNSLPDYRFIYMNRAAADHLRVCGADPDDALGKSPWEVFSSWTDSLAPLYEEVQRTCKVSELHDFRLDIEGHVAYWDVALVPHCDPSGEVTCITTMGLDVTERREAEGLALSLNSINEIIHSTLDTEDVFQRALTEAAGAIGCESAAVSLRIARKWVVHYVQGLPESVVGAEMNDDEEPHALLAIRTREPVAIEDASNDARVNREYMQKWGIKSVLVVPLLMRNEAIGVIFFNYHQSVFTFRPSHLDFASKLALSLSLALENSRLFMELQTELAERSEAQEALKESEERLRLATVAGGIGIWSLDMETGISQWDDRTREIWGVPPGVEITLDIIAERLDPDCRQRLIETITGTKEGHTGYHEELRLIHPDGSERWVISSGRTQFRNGNPIRVFGITMDITEHKAAEEHRLEFYRRTIMAATDGKLVITDRTDIDGMIGPPIKLWEIGSPEDLASIRQDIDDIIGGMDVDPERIGKFKVAIGEAATNALKHAGKGTASIHHTNDGVVLIIFDEGPGIPALTLPDVALRKGYSTAGTLGMGYKIMISFADRVYLATGPEGTCVGMELVLNPSQIPHIIESSVI